MTRRELAYLLAETHPTINPTAHSASAKPTKNSCNQSTMSQPPSLSLSPRQKFQSHVRTLSQDSPSYSGNASPSPLPSPSPTLNSNTYRYSDPTLQGGTPTHNEPHFITEEREAWSRPSPLATRRRQNAPSEDVIVLEPPEDHSPVQQPRKHLRALRPFAPSTQHVDTNERPKTSRGSKPNFGGFPTNDQDFPSRHSKFAEGSMTDRSGGISSSWLENGSISTTSGDESEHSSTPRASPRRSSIDIDDFKPIAVTPGTFKQRLARLGSAFKPSHHASRPEADPRDAKKKTGLRKSMSLWNLHNIAGKSKNTAHSTMDLATTAAQPQKTTMNSDLDLLNDRKRRAEEAYAQHFGIKKRKSNVGLAEPIPEPPREQPPRSRDDRTIARRSMRSSTSNVALTDAEYSDGHIDIDFHKRPSRRELEKENQQLRAMIRQQQESQAPKISKANLERNRSASAKQIPTSSDTSTVDQEKKTPSKKKTSKPRAKGVPPVPSIPDRIALQPLTNSRNQPRSVNTNPATTANTHNSPNVNNNPSVDLNCTATNNSNNNPTRRTLVGAPLPRPVSMILEEDEEGVENRTPVGKRSLIMDDMAKLKQLTPSPIRLHHLQREQWEWPDDIF
ncbi:uncharacterized protein A1O9_01674 [Exophiala aquamarina CBS 119918]|uniref:Uncharacterized protein n=1 Tax=Exophiala aquamarina CBS 119918 TaxID=1182545 RepID=A0A072PV19_9EURO|nr:uncharacterized protein A1O9_01674 [Exophiala aquamarina CBS 119918]KEF63696.1 hypothetical protein A1O9_01674 [Exophiala aquamarina CBS 119918]